MTAATIDLGYRPRDQFRSFHRRKQRWSCIVAHRRAGKTVACIMDLIDYALRCDKPNPRFGYLAPFYAQAKDVAWSYIKQYVAPIPNVEINESELRVVLPNKATIRLYGADNYNRMRGVYFDGVVMDEPADMDPRAWPEVVRPALSDRRGWATFIGTPKGRNSFYEIFQDAAKKPDDWFSMTLRASETGILPDEELTDARSMMSEEQFDQEYECSFDAAILGAYYGKQMAALTREGRVMSVPIDPSIPVYTAWDLGLDDATAVWFVQQAGREVRVIDYLETNNTALSEIAREIMNSKPYTYAEHYLPHDAEIRELTSAKSRKETLESLGLRPIRIAAKHNVEDGIEAVRNFLPRCVFDEGRTELGIECLRQYQREWDDKLKTFRQRPRHDWASHGADAFRYLAVSMQQATLPRERRRPKRGTIA